MTTGTDRLIVGLRRLRGTWRVTVADGSMTPAVLPGDWLLVDPTTRRWPRRGTIVVFREPFTDLLAIKRVAARPRDWVPFADGWLQLGDDEAWLIGDATDTELTAAGHGAANDSRRYGPVTLDALVGRAWFRYGPAARIGRPGPGPQDLLARGRSGTIPIPVPVPGQGAAPSGTPSSGTPSVERDGS
jgi:signal peptidase I